MRGSETLSFSSDTIHFLILFHSTRLPSSSSFALHSVEEEEKEEEAWRRAKDVEEARAG